MNDGPRRIGDVLGEVGRRIGMSRPAETARLWRRWPDIVGEPIAAHAEPTSLRDGVLRVRVSSPVWATEIGYLRDEIRRRANEVVEAPLVTEVRVWSGPRPEEAPSIGATRGDEGAATARDGSRREVPRDRPADPSEALARAREAWSGSPRRTVAGGAAGGALRRKVPGRCYD